MKISREEFLERRLRWAETHLIWTAIAGWVGWAGLIITLAVVFDRLPG